MKKIGFMTLLIMVSVLFTLAFSSAAAAPRTPAAPALTAPAPAALAAAMPTPPHPHIHAALESMRAAKHELESAATDFDGHRVESIKHLDMAIHEAEVCERMR